MYFQKGLWEILGLWDPTFFAVLSTIQLICNFIAWPLDQWRQLADTDPIRDLEREGSPHLLRWGSRSQIAQITAPSRVGTSPTLGGARRACPPIKRLSPYGLRLCRSLCSLTRLCRCALQLVPNTASPLELSCKQARGVLLITKDSLFTLADWRFSILLRYLLRKSPNTKTD